MVISTNVVQADKNVRCDRCGRENPDHLTFCEDCGFALGRARAAASAPAPAQRPAAPDFGLMPPRPAAAAPSSVSTTCPACHTRNEPGHRFCITCGAVLDGAAGTSPVAATQLQTTPAPASRPATLPDGIAAHAVARLADSMAPPPPPMSIAASRTVALGDPRPVPASLEACPRCRTPVPTGAMFCRVCGYSLAEPPTRRDATAELAPLPAPAATPLPSPVRTDVPVPVPQGVAVPIPVPSPSPGFAVAPSVTAPIPSPSAGPASVRRSVGRAVLLERDGTDGKEWPLVGDTVDLGAKEGTILIENDPFLSSRHARLSCERSENGAVSWQVVDLESVNGIYLRLRSKVPLMDGDLILLGQQVLRFDVVKDAEHGLGPATQHGTALFGTPPAPRLARLCQRTVEGVTRDVFHIHRAETSLGRETADIVFTDDPFLSRRHAVITHDSATRRFFIEDAGSSNGTYVAVRGRAPIGHGDILRMGLHVLRIELPASTSETARS